ncbi:MAG: DUF1304 domain-containing protein [Pseudobdellovibrionaceae bacterium]
MAFFINGIVTLTACLHIYFLILEMFLWTKPRGLKIFGLSLEQAKSSAVLAANQGLYNGFLAAGLMWSLIHPSTEISTQLKFFFLTCVAVAGLYGGYTVSKKIAIVQALPAALGLVFLMLA